MFVGTGSESGKSILAAAFCRILKRRGFRAAPFKAQNMALNSGVTPDGREMGRAQIMQAEAAGIAPHADMNPILLKPTSERGSQVVVHGRVYGTMEAAGYYALKKGLWPYVAESYDRLASCHDVIVLEGAGSPVEVNLKENDIVNMAMADYADAGVVLVADIDRGGVFASIVGTVSLLQQDERARLAGFIINKFRGDPALFKKGESFILQKTGLPVLGIVPWVAGLYMPGEDSVCLDRKSSFRCGSGAVAAAVIRLPHMANYTDFDPLEHDPRIDVTYISEPPGLGEYDVIIIPGSKNVVSDYRYLVEKQFHRFLDAYRGNAGRIMGICGGYQMLGESICDPSGIESSEAEVAGLGFLPVSSTMQPDKTTRRAAADIMLPGQGSRVRVEGYEIHMGESIITDPERAVQIGVLEGRAADAGVASSDGRVLGTYLHGIFDSEQFVRAFLRWAGNSGTDADAPAFSYRLFKERNYDMLADIVEQQVNVDYVLEKCGIEPTQR